MFSGWHMGAATLKIREKEALLVAALPQTQSVTAKHCCPESSEQIPAPAGRGDLVGGAVAGVVLIHCPLDHVQPVVCLQVLFEKPSQVV